MSLDPLLATPFVVQIHAFAAMAAFALGGIQLAAPKGALPHRALGYVWVTLMLLIAISSFWIRKDGFSFIHAISIFTLMMLPLAIFFARRGRIAAHRKSMIGLYAGALVIAGVFTLLPGRVMHTVVFGN